MSKVVSRRGFLKLGALAGAGLVVGFVWPGAQAAQADQVPANPGVQTYQPNAFLRIGSDNRVTVLIPKSEMGQGVLTSLAMILAEELDVAWEDVRAEEAPAGKPYRLGILGQLTAGSDSIRGTYEPLRKAGATARAMLVAAAADKLGVAESSLRTAAGHVHHDASSRKVSYGELAQAASGRSAPWRVALKDPSQFKLIGTRVMRLDLAQKTNGTAQYGLDVRLPGMLYACVARCPVFGGKARSYVATKALAIRGVKKVIHISSGIAVIATNTWAAMAGVKALTVKWDEGPNAKFNTAQQREDYRTLAIATGRKVLDRGDAAAALTATGNKALAATFELPYLAHTTMEPPNFTASVTATDCEVWGGTQAQTAAQAAAMAVTGFDEDHVQVHTTFLGGGFGRRAEADFVTEAVECAKAAGVPVQVVWTRTDDLHHDFYRPANTHRIAGAVDAAGWPTAWQHHVVAQSVLVRFMPSIVFAMVHDPITQAGLADEFPYAIPNARFEVTDAVTPVPVGFWRSVGWSHNVFVAEHFLDELCRLGGKDPLVARRRLMAAQPRLLACLELAASKAGWGQPLPKGHFRGLAACSPFGSHIAQVLELSIEGGEVKVHRVVSAVDCGQVINPSIVEHQIESGVVFGLSAALKGEITLDKGRVQQDNFDTYAPLRSHETPRMETYIVPSTAAPGGIGEVGVPCVAPAMANALLAARGLPFRGLPIRLG